MDGGVESLSSDIKLVHDSLIINYYFEKGTTLDGSSSFKVKKASKFKMIYVYKDQKWVSRDSAKLKDLMI